MNNYNIFVNSDEIDAKLVKLREYKKDMEEKLNNIKLGIDDLPNTWSGQVGDNNYEVLNKYSQDFEVIMKRIESFIDFLEKAKEAYKSLDEGIDKKAGDFSSVSVLDN